MPTADKVFDNEVVTGRRVIWCDFGGALTDPPGAVLNRVAQRCAVPADVLLAAYIAVAAEYGGDGLAPLETGRLAEPEWGRKVMARLAPMWRPRADLAFFSRLWYADRGFNDELDGLLASRPLGG